MHFTGFVIQGVSGQMTSEDMYGEFSGLGIVLTPDVDPEQSNVHLHGGMPVFHHMSDLPGGDVDKAVDTVTSYATEDTKFYVFRTILQTATFHYEGPPSPPVNVIAVNNDFQTENFTILLTWEGQETGTVDTYIISINTTTQPVYTDITSILVEGKYNNPIHINISAENCAGTSGDVIKEIYEAGCSTPQAPVNGSVSGFTSSRVGAQVTYHCNTGLVMVGETVTSCSSPSLQWLPSVMCVQTAECGDPGALYIKEKCLYQCHCKWFNHHVLL